MVDSNIDDMFKKMTEARDRYQAKAMSIPGVFGTSIGIRQVAGKLVAEPAIIFHVEKKRSLQEIPVDGRIPKELEGFPTDVVAEDPPATDGAPHTQAADVNDDTKYRPLKGGCQIAEGHTYPYGTGTLGCAVKYIGSDRPSETLYNGRIYVLSASHVMLGVGNHIFQPTNLGDRIGSVRASVLDDWVDAAIADIGWYLDGAVPEIIDIGPVKGSYTVTAKDLTSNSGYPVKKRGRTTGLTSGTIYALGYNGTNRPGGDKKAVKDQIKIVTRDSDNNIVAGFADAGDSGSVVINNNGQVIGLLTSMTLAGTEGYYFTTPIRTVLNRLQIEILV